MKETTNMENLTTIDTTTKKSGRLWKALALSLCTALTLGNISCGKTTAKDVMRQEQKMEEINHQIANYIKARKKLAEDYNSLLAYPVSESNKRDIKLSLSVIYETIVEYDEKIQELSEDRLDAERVLNDYTAEVEGVYAPNTPIDPNRRDFLLR